MRSQIAITGLGPVCSIGVGVDEFWNSVLNNTISHKPIEAFDASGYKPQIAGEVKNIKVRDFVPKSYRKATKVMARDTELAVISAKLAAQDAGLSTRADSENPDHEGFAINASRTGCQIGAGLIAAETEELARAVVTAEDDNNEFSMKNWGTIGDGQSGMNNLPPLWLLKYLPNMLACHVTIVHGLEGPSNTIMGAEASALLSIGESARVIERGDADICFTGGAESRINPLGLLRWDYTGRLADTSALSESELVDNPQICTPYDSESSGGIIGESGGMIILENLEHAQSRDAKIYAALAGFGAGQTPPNLEQMAQDPLSGNYLENSNTQPDFGLVAAIENAFHDAQVSPEDIDLIIPLGLGVPHLDQMELAALRNTFGSELTTTPYLPISQQVGNTIAGHGGLQMAVAAKCIEENMIPSHAKSFEDASFKPNENTPVRHVLVCAGSLGGQTAAMILKNHSRA